MLTYNLNNLPQLYSMFSQLLLMKFTGIEYVGDVIVVNCDMISEKFIVNNICTNTCQGSSAIEGTM